MEDLRKFDVIVVGSGIAGLSFALKSADNGYKVAIITKKDSQESNTNYAQGGIASVTSHSDEVELHVKDTLEAGDGLCDRSAVEQILKDGPKGIRCIGSKRGGFLSIGRWSNFSWKGRRALKATNPSCERYDRKGNRTSLAPLSKK